MARNNPVRGDYTITFSHFSHYFPEHTNTLNMHAHRHTDPYRCNVGVKDGKVIWDHCVSTEEWFEHAQHLAIKTHQSSRTARALIG